MIGPMVTPLARRRPHQLARETVTLDRLSGGRLVLGVGLGSERTGEFDPARFGEEGDAARPRAAARRRAGAAGGLLGRRVRAARRSSSRGSRSGSASRWPHRRPLRRAARWDGAVPDRPAGPGRARRAGRRGRGAARAGRRPLRRRGHQPARHRPGALGRGGRHLVPDRLRPAADAARGRGRDRRASGLVALRSVTATRYVTPLREGGSLPALVEADDDGLYVVKFRGAGQGPKALVAELRRRRAGARRSGCRCPSSCSSSSTRRSARAEPDPEIQELLAGQRRASTSAWTSCPARCRSTPRPSRPVDPALAADVVWFDALVTNVDRTPRNPNLLVWHGRLWLIDHGAALLPPARRRGRSPRRRTRPFPLIADHVLLPLRRLDRRGRRAAAPRRRSARRRATRSALVPERVARPGPGARAAAYARRSSRGASRRRARFVEEAERARR